jgi:hypothetical protein
MLIKSEKKLFSILVVEEVVGDKIFNLRETKLKKTFGA